MYSFHLDNTPYGARDKAYNCMPQPDADIGEKPKPTSTKLKDLKLEVGQRLLFLQVTDHSLIILKCGIVVLVNSHIHSSER
jgi:hypothetical protein